MRVLYISHACVLRVNQQRLVEMADIPDLEICLVAPTTWEERSIGKEYTLEADYSSRYRLVPGKITPVLRGGLGYVFLTGLGQAMRDFRPDIVHVEAETTSLTLTQAALWSMWGGARLVAMCWENMHKKPMFSIAAVERFNLRALDCVLAGNDEIAQVLRGKRFGKPIEIVPLGFDPALFHPMDVARLRRQLGLRGFVVGYMGRLVPEKGVETLLEAIARLDMACTLLLDGSGAHESRIRHLAAELGILNNVVFVDPAHAEVPKYMNCMDTLVLPSITTPKWKEQFGRVLVEAMACGVPVVASDSGELPNTVGDAGLIFRERDADDLAMKLKAVADDVSLRERLVRLGHERASRYTWQTIAGRTFDAYTRLMGESRSQHDHLPSPKTLHRF